MATGAFGLGRKMLEFASVVLPAPSPYHFNINTKILLTVIHSDAVRQPTGDIKSIKFQLEKLVSSLMLVNIWKLIRWVKTRTKECLSMSRLSDGLTMCFNWVTAAHSKKLPVILQQFITFNKPQIWMTRTCCCSQIHSGISDDGTTATLDCQSHQNLRPDNFH